MLTKKKIKLYNDILKEELLPALGCTEPIALAFAAAKAKSLLKAIPTKTIIKCSGNIIKNVKGVVVPNCGGLKGIEAAIAIGLIAGDSDKKLQVLYNVKDEDIEKAKKYLKLNNIKIEVLKTNAKLHLEIIVFDEDNNNASVEIIHQHTNVVKVTKNNEVIYQAKSSEQKENLALTDRTQLNVTDIVHYAEIANLDPIKQLLETQIKYNTAISNEGLKNDWGANVGSSLLKSFGNDIRTRATAAAAAGSDARMSGCVFPVIINSGSGNQGMTVSLPIIEYAKYDKIGKDKLLRALALGNLLAIHQKTAIGRLSAYCGVVTAAAAAGASITWMQGGNLKQIEDTIINSLANLSGMVCDGAKPSCAIKIASAVNASIMAHSLAMHNQVFSPGDGIVKKDIEETIKGVGKIASVGMKDTDKTILDVMVYDNQNC